MHRVSWRKTRFPSFSDKNSNFVPLFRNKVFPKNLEIAEGFARGNFEAGGKIRGSEWGTNKIFRLALLLKVILEQKISLGARGWFNNLASFYYYDKEKRFFIHLSQKKAFFCILLLRKEKRFLIFLSRRKRSSNYYYVTVRSLLI